MAEAAETEPSAAKPARTFFGEPPALAYLSFTEAWERFSYYGMTALLVLYMSQALFLPGRIGHVAGFAAFRAGLESVFGPMTTLALASQVFGLYTAFVYFTPVFGGLIADRWIGRRRAVMTGAILMSAGHIAMAFDRLSCWRSCCSSPAADCSRATSPRRSASSTPKTTGRGARAAIRSSRWASMSAQRRAR